MITWTYELDLLQDMIMDILWDEQAGKESNIDWNVLHDLLGAAEAAYEREGSQNVI